MIKKIAFTHDFEKKVVQAILTDEIYAEQIMDVLEPDLFELSATKQVSSILRNYYYKYNKFPSTSLLKNIIETESNSEVVKKECLTLLLNMISHPLNGDIDYVKDKSLMFFRTQHVKNALSDSVLPKLEDGANLDDIVPIIQQAVSKGTNRDLGMDYLSDESRFIEEETLKIPTPWAQINSVLNGGFGQKRLVTFIGSSGCHAKGTKILKSNGEFINVEDVKKGDKLLGPDGSPRNVLRLIRGNQQMARIVPVKGKSFVVNLDHILSLKSKNKILNISVFDFLQKQSALKQYKLYKPEAIEFERQKEDLTISPYMLGVMIGDGWISKKRVEITTADQAVVEEIYAFAKNNNLGVSQHYKKDSKAVGYYFTNNFKHNNPLIENLNKLQLLNTNSGNKFIPSEYKFSTIENRLEVLAGLLDTDGHYTNGGFEYVTKSKVLSDDVSFICLSLGFRSTVSKKIINNIVYYRHNISGHCDKIPTRIKRKQAPQRRQIKNCLVTGFSVELLENQDYFGFELDGDNLYIMEDFFVTHNSGKSHMLVNCGVSALLAGKKVCHYTLELDSTDVSRRYDARLCEIKINDIPKNKDRVKSLLKEKLPPGAGLRIKEFPMVSVGIQAIKAHLNQLKLQEFIPDIIIIDYGDLLLPSHAESEHRGNLRVVWQEMKALAQTLKIPVVTATQGNRSSAEAEILTLDLVAEDFSKIMTSDIIITAARNTEQKQAGIGKMLLGKNRQGEDGIVYDYTIDTSYSRIEIIELNEEDKLDLKQKLENLRKKTDVDDIEEYLRKKAKKVDANEKDNS